MARPTQAKEAKPKLSEAASGGGSGGGGSSAITLLIMAVIIVLGTSLSSAASVYFLAPMVLKPIIVELVGEGEHGDGGEHGDETPSIGPVVDLEEFTVNLKDPGGNRYLRADFSIMVTTDDPNFGHGGGGGHGGDDPATAAFHAEMAHYVPAIRDIIITSLTKRTAAEISTIQGKEQLKLEIARQVDGVFHGTHKVIRVNIENFIIQ